MEMGRTGVEAAVSFAGLTVVAAAERAREESRVAMHIRRMVYLLCVDSYHHHFITNC